LVCFGSKAKPSPFELFSGVVELPLLMFDRLSSHLSEIVGSCDLGRTRLLQAFGFCPLSVALEPEVLKFAGALQLTCFQLVLVFL